MHAARGKRAHVRRVLSKEFALLPRARTCDKYNNAPSTRARAQRTQHFSVTRICLHPEFTRITGEKTLLQIAEGNLDKAREESAIDPEVRNTEKRTKVQGKLERGALT